MIRLIPKILAAIVAVVLLVVGGLSVALPRLVNSDEFRAELAKQGKRERDHKTNHEYSLEEFGLEADAIRDRLGVLFGRFGWDEGGGGETASREESASA